MHTSDFDRATSVVHVDTRKDKQEDNSAEENGLGSIVVCGQKVEGKRPEQLAPDAR